VKSIIDHRYAILDGGSIQAAASVRRAIDRSNHLVDLSGHLVSLGRCQRHHLANHGRFDDEMVGGRRDNGPRCPRSGPTATCPRISLRFGELALSRIAETLVRVLAGPVALLALGASGYFICCYSFQSAVLDPTTIVVGSVVIVPALAVPPG